MKKLRAIVTVVALAATTYVYGQCPAQPGAYQYSQSGYMQGPGQGQGRYMQGPQGGYSSQYTTRQYTETQSGVAVDERSIQNQIQNPNVRVSVNNGVVTLRGTVNSNEEKRNIEERVSAIPGVRDVDNQLTVADSSRTSTSSSYSSNQFMNPNRTDSYNRSDSYNRTDSYNTRTSPYSSDRNRNIFTDDYDNSSTNRNRDVNRSY